MNFFSCRGLGQNILCRWREFLREPSAILFVVIMPPLWILLLGAIFGGGGGTSYQVGLVDGSEPAVVARLTEDRTLKVQIATLDELLAEVGKVQVIVEITEQQATYYFDSNDSQSRAAHLYIDSLIQSFHERQDPITTVIKEAPPKMRYIDFFIPGLLAFSIMASSFFGTGMSIVSSRRENLLKRFLITPMSPLSYVLSHVVGRLLVLLVEIIVIVLSGLLFYSFEIQGSIIAFVVYAAIGAATFTSLATLLGSRGRNVSTCYSVINIITLPLALFSGIWFESSYLPQWLADLFGYLPLAPLADGLRAIAVEGRSIVTLMPQVLLLFIYALGAAIVARSLFKWY